MLYRHNKNDASQPTVRSLLNKAESNGI